MECGICYEKFLINKTKEEYIKLIEENMNNCNDMLKLDSLVITPKKNTTYKCPTDCCPCIICNYCFVKLTHNGKTLEEARDKDIPNYNSKVICPYCKQVDYKYYMKNKCIRPTTKNCFKSRRIY